MPLGGKGKGNHVRRRTIAILVAVVLALVAAGLVVWYVSSLRGEKQVAEPTQTVLVATANIPVRTSGEAIIANKLVEEQKVVASSVAPGAITSAANLEGLVLTVPVAKGQQILNSQLGAPEKQSLSYRIKVGMRALAIPVDRKNAVGGAIKEGDRVDVIVTFTADQFNAVQMANTATTTAPPGTITQPTTATQGTPMNLGMVLSTAEIDRIKALTGLDLSQTISNVSITLMQQVTVLDVDNLLPVVTQQSNGGGGVLGGSQSKSTTKEVPDTPVITLELTPGDAEKLVYAQEFGKITFTLVPAEDTVKADTTGQALPNLFR